MDRKSLVKNLRNVFLKNEAREKYSKAWLDYTRFAGLFKTEKNFELHVALKQKAATTFDDIKSVLDFLRTNASDEKKHIWTVKLHDPEVDLYDVRRDMILYTEEEE